MVIAPESNAHGGVWGVGRAILAAGIMAVGLGLAGAVGILIQAWLGVGDRGQQAITALTCGLVVVPLVVLLQRRVDRQSMASLGLNRRRALGQFALGVLITGGAAIVMVAVGVAAGWVRIGSVQLPTLLSFLAFNTVFALTLEAIPEELTLRGYAYRALASWVRRWIAAVGVTMLFLLVPVTSTVVRETVLALFGHGFGLVTFAPDGGDPYAYGILMVFFGGTLIVTRVVTGSLWPCIALHLTFLTVNRLVVASDGRNTGWAIDSTVDAQLLVPAYLVLTAAALLVLVRLAGGRMGWAEPGEERVPAPATPS